MTSQLLIDTGSSQGWQVCARLAARTTVGQDFGSVIWNAEFDMLAPGMTESSITIEIGERYEQFSGQEKVS